MTDDQGELFPAPVPEAKADRTFVLGGSLSPEDRARRDRPAGRRARDVGMDRAEQNSDAEWVTMALAAIREAARRYPTLTADTVFLDLPAPREGRVMGPVMQQARRRGWIAPTGQYVSAQNKKQHAGPTRVWRSLIVGQP
jgi:hypothetical protein